MTILKLNDEQATTVFRYIQRRREDCASVLTPEYQRAYPVAASPENIAERKAELVMLDGILEQLKGQA